MDINELVHHIMYNSASSGEKLTVQKVFMDNFYYRFKSGQIKAAKVFYESPHESTAAVFIEDGKISYWDKFITAYTCYLLAHYDGINMKEAVNLQAADGFFRENFLMEQITAVSKKYTPNNAFELIAFDAYFRRHPGIKDFVKSSEFIQQIKNKLAFEIYKHSNDFEVLQILLFLSKYTKNDEEVLKKWMGYDSDFCTKFKVDKYINYLWYSTYIHENLFVDKDIYNTLKPYVHRACDKKRIVTRRGTVTSYTSQSASSHKEDFTDTYWGEDACEWLKTEGAKYLVGTLHCYTSTQPGIGDDAGCVVAGTKILMADLMQKPVEQVAYKDAVMNCGERTSYCSKEHITNNRVRHLYAVNDDIPFMSLEHAILTKRGWCAPNFNLANQINADHEVKELMVGDVFDKYCVENGQLVKYETVIEKINIVENCNLMPCHDLHFSFGEQSYIANEYPCLLNYPNITISSVKEKLKDKGTAEIVKAAEPFLTMVLGESQTELLMQGENLI